MKKVFDSTTMNLARLDWSGGSESPEARCQLQVALNDQMRMDLNLDKVLGAPEIDLDKGVHLHPDCLDLGATFKVKLSVLEKRNDAKLISARCNNQKGATVLNLSVLIPCKDWAEFGFLTDFKGEDIEVTIWPGAKQENLPMEE